MPALKMKRADGIHLQALFTGHHAFLFWYTQLTGLILPIILVIFKPFRKPGILAIISGFVVMGAWLKRYIIVIPTMEHPNLPIQGVPENFMHYSPTLQESAITFMTLVMALMIISVLAKVFPVIPIWEMAEEEETENHKNSEIA